MIRDQTMESSSVQAQQYQHFESCNNVPSNTKATVSINESSINKDITEERSKPDAQWRGSNGNTSKANSCIIC